MTKVPAIGEAVVAREGIDGARAGLEGCLYDEEGCEADEGLEVELVSG